jgi:hypothetical protein
MRVIPWSARFSALAAAVVLSAGAAPSLPAGTRIPARMNTSIATRAALGPNRIPDVHRAGEEYAASVTDPVGSGCARIDPGAVVHGRVSELRPGVELSGVKLALTADDIDGRPVAAHVVASDVERVPATDLGRTADSAAFAGIVMGGVFFGLPGIMIGYGAGASAGAIGAYNERRVEAWLPAGSSIQVELDEPLTLPTRRTC